MFVLHISLQSTREHGALSAHGIKEFHRPAVVGERIPGRVPPFPFANPVAYQFGTTADAPSEGVAVLRPGTVMGEGDDPCLEVIARMLVEDTRAECFERSFRPCTGGEDILTGDIEVLPFVRIETG